MCPVLFRWIIIILVPPANSTGRVLSCQLQRSVHETVIVGRQIARDGQLSQQGQGATFNLSIKVDTDDLFLETPHYLVMGKIAPAGFDRYELRDFVQFPGCEGISTGRCPIVCYLSSNRQNSVICSSPYKHCTHMIFYSVEELLPSCLRQALVSLRKGARITIVADLTGTSGLLMNGS